MAKMEIKVKIVDLPQFKLFLSAAPAWLEQVTQSDYEVSKAEKDLFGAILAISEIGNEET